MPFDTMKRPLFSTSHCSVCLQCTVSAGKYSIGHCNHCCSQCFQQLHIFWHASFCLYLMHSSFIHCKRLTALAGKFMELIVFADDIFCKRSLALAGKILALLMSQQPKLYSHKLWLSHPVVSSFLDNCYHACPSCFPCSVSRRPPFQAASY